MAKLTKAEAAKHREACELLKLDVLSYDQRLFVLEHWNEAAEHEISAAGAFFTPPSLANDFMIDIPTHGRLVDICAGIGALSFAALHWHEYRRESVPQITCIELCPRYVEVGRKILPEATWICADALDPETWAGLGHFDAAYSNPPFGAPHTYQNRSKTAAGRMEFAIIEQAVSVSDYAGFIIPRQSAPFQVSGQHGFTQRTEGPGIEHETKTGIKLRPGCGVDADFHLQDWKNTKPCVELVYWDRHEDGHRLKSETPPPPPALRSLPQSAEQLALF